jgi:hypothetical protein
MSRIESGDNKKSFEFNGVTTLGILAGVVFVYLGYKLFGQSVVAGTGTITAKIAHGLADIGITGPWPGMFFMAIGGVVIMVALLSVGKTKSSTPTARKKRGP